MTKYPKGSIAKRVADKKKAQEDSFPNTQEADWIDPSRQEVSVGEVLRDMVNQVSSSRFRLERIFGKKYDSETAKIRAQNLIREQLLDLVKVSYRG